MASDARRALIAVSSAIFFIGLAAAAPQPLEHFARMPQIRDVAISPDGRHVAFISALDEGSAVMTFDRQKNGEFQRVAASEPGRFDVRRCAWANNDRVVCVLVGNIRGKRYAELPFIRTMAVDAGGANLKTLDKATEKGNLLAGKTTPQNLNIGMNMRTASGLYGNRESSFDFVLANNGYSTTSENFGGQRRDQIIDVTVNERDTVLIQAIDESEQFPSVFNLNVYNGFRGVLINPRPPIRQFLADGRGEVRLGWGARGRADPSYFARNAAENKWQPLERLDAFTQRRPLLPIGIEPERNLAYAIAEHEGRSALWSVDLEDRRDPEILLSHEKVDLGAPLLTSDRRLIGIRYELDRPFAYYTDESLRDIVNRINGQYAPRFHVIVDMTRDGKTLVLRSYSDVEEGTYYLFDTDEKKLKRLGTAYPELKTESLGTMKPITYKAADGTEIPGYLTVPSGTVPRGVPAGKLPLIVMPHDGPVARDIWQFSFLRNFLANRGYAVLQMNYRGSSGYGQKWRRDAHENWGGVTWSDIDAATRWAIAEGIADPKRVCIAGWGFGGYAALLGVARDSAQYKCAISIAGISDLQMLRDHVSVIGGDEQAYLLQQIGTDGEKLTRDSPLHQVASIGSPVLLVHGDRDWQVQIDQSKKMASELKKHKKEHKAIFLKDAGHDLDRKADRMTLLKEVEEFLLKNLGPGTQPVSSAGTQ